MLAHLFIVGLPTVAKREKEPRSSLGKWLNIEVAYLYKGMLLSLERGRHSDKWHHLYEPGGLCAEESASQRERNSSFICIRCLQESGIEKESRGDVGGRTSYSTYWKELSTAVAMTGAQPYECTRFAVTQELLEKFTSCVLYCSFKNGQLIF